MCFSRDFLYFRDRERWIERQLRSEKRKKVKSGEFLVHLWRRFIRLCCEIWFPCSPLLTHQQQGRIHLNRRIERFSLFAKKVKRHRTVCKKNERPPRQQHRDPPPKRFYCVFGRIVMSTGSQQVHHCFRVGLKWTDRKLIVSIQHLALFLLHFLQYLYYPASHPGIQLS